MEPSFIAPYRRTKFDSWWFTFRTGRGGNYNDLLEFSFEFETHVRWKLCARCAP